MNTSSVRLTLLPTVPNLPSWVHLTLLVGVTLLILLSGTFSLPLIDRDEPRFAQATVEMIQKNDYLVPYFNGEYRFDKPPFIYWNMAVFYAVLGVHEISARLPAILHSVLLVLAVYQLGRTFLSPNIGFCAAFGLATCLQVSIHGRLALADLPMIFDVTVAQALLMAILLPAKEERPWTLFALFYIAQALGFLAKGPVVQAITLLTLLIFRFVLWRRPLPWHRLRWPIGLLLMLAIVGCWGIPAMLQTNGLWWKIGMGQHVVARGMESFNGRHYFAPYYLISSLLSLCPWMALGGYAWLAVRQNWSMVNAFLCSWVLATYLIFTCYSTQLPHYVLPAFPAIFLLLAQAITLDPTVPMPRWPGWWNRVLEIVYLLPIVVLATVASTVEDTSLRAVMLGLAFVLAGMLLMVRCYRHWLWILVLVNVGVTCLGLHLVGENLRPLAPAIPIGQWARELPPETRFLARGFSEPSLVFYSDRHWQLDQSLQDLQAATRQPGPLLIVEMVEERSLGQALKWWWSRVQQAVVPPLQGKDFGAEVAQLPVQTWEHHEFTGLNLARSSWVRVMVYYRAKE